jgi:hypothetical protein
VGGARHLPPLMAVRTGEAMLHRGLAVVTGGPIQVLASDS